MAPIITYSKRIQKHYSHFFKENLEFPSLKNRFFNLFRKNGGFAVGWGYKNSANVLEGKFDDFLRLEDGLIRSAGLGADMNSWSLIKNRIPYFNSQVPSDLEKVIVEGDYSSFDEEEVREAIESIKRYRLTKYNSWIDGVDFKTEAKILILDQVEGDNSLVYGATRIFPMEEIISDLQADYPSLKIDIKVHPESPSTSLSGLPGINKVIKENFNIHDLIGNYDHIVTRTSQVGFEALLHGKNVICYGVPFYAGWGLTVDKDVDNPSLKRRERMLSVEELFYMVMVKNTEYRHPGTKKQISLNLAIEELNKTTRIDMENAGNIVCIYFSLWKEPHMRDFLRSTRPNKVTFVRKKGEKLIAELKRMKLREHFKILHWGQDIPQDLAIFARENSIQIVIVEDGFLRSKQIGALRTRPYSMVMDEVGIYFNPQSPSQLENMLNGSKGLTNLQKARAEKLIGRILENGVSKYNNAQHKELAFENKGKRVILVPGQVNDDASIRFGSELNLQNDTLLRRVREENPDAYLVYKPHPDVLAGKRDGGDIEMLLEEGVINEIVRDVSLSSCIKASDEVHTITSLSGFEAIMHGKKVVCYGVPFYAGWGLTVDKDITNQALGRRKNKVSLEELFYLAYVEYPRYYSEENGYWTSPEDIIEKLAVS